MKGKILLAGDVNSAHFRKWAAGAAACGFETAVWSLHRPVEDWYSSKGIALLSSDTTSGKRKRSDVMKLSYLFSLGSFKNAVKKFDPAVVHAHYATSYALLGRLSGFKSLVISAWGSDIMDFPKRSMVHRRMLSANLNSARLIISPGEFLKQRISSFTSVPVSVIPFGVDTDFFTPAERKNELITIGTVKSLEPVYRIDVLIRAFARACEMVPDKPLRLLICGDGSMKNQMLKLCDDLGIAGKTEFTGRISPADVPSYLQRMDIFANLSERESFGVSILEASSCGLPVIVSDAEGLQEVVRNNETGIVVTAGDVEKTAHAIVQLVSDRELSSRYGNAGRDFVVEKYSWNKSLERMNEMYNGFLH